MVGGKGRFVVGDGVQPYVGCYINLGIAEVGSGEVCIGHGAAFYSRVTKVRIAEVGTGKVTESYIRIRKVCAFEISKTEIYFVEVSRAEVVGTTLLLTEAGNNFPLNVVYLNHHKGCFIF